MPTGDEYRLKAAEINATAKFETAPAVRVQLENIALAYLRLADQADKNAACDLIYETPPPRPAVAQQQQQQQPQPSPTAGRVA